MKAKNDGKSHQWVINDEGDQPPITIPTRDVEAYLRTGVTEELRAHPEFIYRGMHLTPDDPTPCGRRLRRPHPRGAIGQRSWVL